MKDMGQGGRGVEGQIRRQNRFRQGVGAGEGGVVRGDVTLLAGPVSDHFDGERFFDPRGAPPKSRARSVAVGWSTVTGAPPRRLGPPRRRRLYADRPPARVEGAAWRNSYVGHASPADPDGRFESSMRFPCGRCGHRLFRFVGPKRVNDPGIAFADLPPIDVVLVSPATTIILMS